MIEEYLVNSNPMFITGMAGNYSCSVLNLPSESTVEFCSCKDCDYEEYALISMDGKPHKNDKTSVLVRRLIATESFVFKLEKNGVVVATLNNTTYGEYFDFGSLLYSFYKGYILDWKKVYDVHGYGNYRILVEKTFASVTTTTYSHLYLLRLYSPSIAKGTVKIETYQNGNYVLNDPYRGMNWYQSIRVNGKLTNSQPKLESIEYIDNNRQRNQIQDKIITSYELFVRSLPSFISDTIVYGQMLANEIYVSDYNINHRTYFKKPLKINSIKQAKDYTNSNRMSYVLELLDKAEGTIKQY